MVLIIRLIIILTLIRSPTVPHREPNASELSTKSRQSMCVCQGRAQGGKKWGILGAAVRMRLGKVEIPDYGLFLKCYMVIGMLFDRKKQVSRSVISVVIIFMVVYFYYFYGIKETEDR